MSTAYIAFTGDPEKDDLKTSCKSHNASILAATEYFQANQDDDTCMVASIPASTKNIHHGHHLWDDIRHDPSDTESVTRERAIDSIRSGLYHKVHEQNRLNLIEHDYNYHMNRKGRFLYYFSVLLPFAATFFFPAGFFDIYFYWIAAVYATWLGLIYYVVHLGMRGFAHESNPPALEPDELIKELSNKQF